MVKVFRKNRKWLLAGFGVLLITTFLFSGTADLFKPDPRKTKLAEAGGQVIYALDSDQAARDYELMRDFAPGTVGFDLGIESGLHWQLLVMEAERAGLVGEEGDGADPGWLGQLAETEAAAEVRLQDSRMPGFANFVFSNPTFFRSQVENVQGRFEAARAQLVSNARLSEDQFDLTLAKLRGIIRLIDAYSNAARLSDRQLRADAFDMFSGTLADAVIIPAERISNETPAPTPEQVQAQYERYKAVNPGEGEHGFGYVQPPRVKLEWLELSRNAVGAAVTLDPVEVSRHYQKNRGSFPGEYDAERANVETALRNAKVDEIVNQFDSIYKSRLKNAARGLPTNNFYKVLPADWASRGPTLTALAADVAKTVSELTGVQVPTPTVTARIAQWTLVRDARLLPGIGEAVLASPTRRVTFEQLLGATHELSPAAALGLQAGFPFDQHLTAPDGDRFYLHVLEARLPSPPDSIDEVRAEVERDVRRKWAYDKLVSEAPTYRELATSAGLAAVGELFARPADGPLPATPGIAPISNLQISRRIVGGSRDAASLDIPEVRDAIMDGVKRLGFTVAPDASNVSARTFVIPLPKSLSVGVIQVTYPVPLTQESLRSVSESGLRRLLAQEATAATAQISNAFSLEAVKARLAYRDLRPKGEIEGGEPDPTVDAPPADPAPTPAG
ncbi:MAG: hypothetical protein SFY69_00925 [Planctomycetota bacterium]|nr:hypothetical protein [Planctomycetota bacterium]